MSEDRLSVQYRRRFEAEDTERVRVWRVLVDSWFSRHLGPDDAVLDLGCGWGPFVNQIGVRRRYGLDLNSDSRRHLDGDVTLFARSADQTWPVDDGELDVVFSSNFLEHLADRDAVLAALDEAHRCLRPGGRLVLMGPNIKYVGGAYWDFFDHFIPLTETSVTEAAELAGFETDEAIARFLPYTMAGRRPAPAVFIRAYLWCRPAWRVLGKQFLYVGTRL